MVPTSSLEESMMPRLIILLLGFLLSNCQKISNNINNVEFECGGSAELESFRYVKLLSNSGVIGSAEGIQVRDEVGQDYGGLVTPKGCLRLPRNLQDKLMVARPAANEGYVLYPNRVATGSVQSHVVKTHRYNALTSLCQSEIVTSSAQMNWPIDWAGVDSSSYAWQLVIQKERNVRLSLQRNGVEDLNRETIDLTGFEDGIYQLIVQGRQLFSKDKVETRFDCQLIIDRESPQVSLDRDLVRIEG